MGMGVVVLMAILIIMRMIVGMSALVIMWVRVWMWVIVIVLVAIVMRMVVSMPRLVVVRMGMVMRLFARVRHGIVPFLMRANADIGSPESRQMRKQFLLDRHHDHVGIADGRRAVDADLQFDRESMTEPAGADIVDTADARNVFDRMADFSRDFRFRAVQHAGED